MGCNNTTVSGWTKKEIRVAFGSKVADYKVHKYTLMLMFLSDWIDAIRSPPPITNSLLLLLLHVIFHALELSQGHHTDESKQGITGHLEMQRIGYQRKRTHWTVVHFPQTRGIKEGPSKSALGFHGCAIQSIASPHTPYYSHRAYARISFVSLPIRNQSITATKPAGCNWIFGAGKHSAYSLFVLRGRRARAQDKEL